MNGRLPLSNKSENRYQVNRSGLRIRRCSVTLIFLFLLVSIAALSFRQVVRTDPPKPQTQLTRVATSTTGHPTSGHPSTGLPPSAAPGDENENPCSDSFMEEGPARPKLEGDLDGTLSDHDEIPSPGQIFPSGSEGAEGEQKDKEKADSTSQTVMQRLKPETTAAVAATFEMDKAWAEWDKAVGCAAFREKHKALIRSYSAASWVPSPSFQRLLDPKTDGCSAFKLKHVTVFLASVNWLPDWMDGSFTCSCGVSCIFSRSKILAPDPDVELYQGGKRPLPRRQGESLKATLNLESSANTPPANIWIHYSPNATVQCTFAGNIFHIDRSRKVAGRKREDVPLFFAASNPSPHRETLAKPILQNMPHHSVGARLNNMEGVSEFDMYPSCKHDITRDFGSSIHCVLSHYKFALGVENKVDLGYVTERLFYPLEAGTVPIYIGAPDVAEFAPPDSFIDARGMDPQEVQRKVLELANDTVGYMNFHAWRRCGVLGNYRRARALSLDTVPCRLCEEASRRGGRQEATT